MPEETKFIHRNTYLRKRDIICAQKLLALLRVVIILRKSHLCLETLVAQSGHYLFWKIPWNNRILLFTKWGLPKKVVFSAKFYTSEWLKHRNYQQILYSLDHYLTSLYKKLIWQIDRSSRFGEIFISDSGNSVSRKGIWSFGSRLH